jgi:endonuclease G, mitochondrial
MRFVLYSIITIFTCLHSFSIRPLKNCALIRELTPHSAGDIIEHTYFKLAYSEMHEQAIWVFYMLTPEFLNSSIYRTNDFRVDPEIETGSATPEDYKGSGYDRGHLCPAADMKINESSVSESFFMSNISPQEPEFHRQIWGKLELQVREWAKKEDTIVVVAGPIFRNNKGTIGANRVTIPGYYYKIVFDLTRKKKMIALVFKNSYEKRPVENWVVSVDSVEKLTGIDFFPGLPNEVENKLESNSDIRLWNFDVFNSKTMAQATKKGNDSKPTGTKSELKQCMGTAKSTGNRCRTLTENANGFCNDHQKQAIKTKH